MKTQSKVGIIMMGTSPELSKGGIASVLPSYTALFATLGIPCVFIPTHSNDRFSGKYRHFTRALPAMIKAIRKFKAKSVTPIVYAHAGQWPSLMRKKVFLLVARSLGARTILHLHGAEIEEYTKHLFQRNGLIKLIQGQDFVFTLTPYWSELVSNLNIQNAKIRVVPNPLSNELSVRAQSPPILKKSTKTINLLSMNRLIPGKGFEFLIETFALLPKHFRLTIAGEGEILENLKLLAHSSGCSDRIEFPGWVSGKIKQTLFESADVFCLFTLRDCMSTVILEAMSEGLPIIATDYGPTRDLVPDSVGIFIKKTDTPLVAAKAIEKMATKAEILKQMSASAKQNVLAKYSLDQVSSQFQKILLEINTVSEVNQNVGPS